MTTKKKNQILVIQRELKNCKRPSRQLGLEIPRMFSSFSSMRKSIMAILNRGAKKNKSGGDNEEEAKENQVLA